MLPYIMMNKDEYIN